MSRETAKRANRVLRAMGKTADIAGSEMILPNTSGDHVRSIKRAAPVDEKDLVNKEYVDGKNVESFPTTFAAGSVIFSDGNNLAEDNFNLFWNNATNELQSHHIKIVSDGTQAAPALKFNDTNTGFFKVADSIRLSINNSTKMTVDATGVGIGTTTPFSKLSVTGASSENTFDVTGGSSIFSITTGNGAGTDNALQFGILDDDYSWITSMHPGSGFNYLIFQPNGGNVGIGTKSPAEKLHVNGNAVVNGNFDVTTDGVVFYVDGEAARVGIGTATPNSKLEVVGGDIEIDNSAFCRVLHTIAGTLTWSLGPRTTDDYYIQRESGTGDVLIPAGNVGINVLDPDSKLEVNGNVHIDGDLFFETDGSGLPYGSCYGNDIAWTQVAAINVVYNVSDADMVTGQLNLATHDGSGKLTVTKAGRYKCDYTATIKSSIAGKHIISGFEVSGSGNMEPAGRNHIDLVGANNQLECSGNAILDLAANATIEMAINSSDAGNPIVTVEHLNITLFQIGGT